MLVYRQLSDYFNALEFDAVVRGLPREGARLGQSSVSHPIFDLLRVVRQALIAKDTALDHEGRGTDYARDARTRADDLKHVPAAAALALKAMLALPSKQALQPDFELSLNQTQNATYDEVSRTAFGSSRNEHTAAASLIENLASLGWVEGIDVLAALEKPLPNEQLIKAMVRAAREQRPEALEKIFAMQQKWYPGMLKLPRDTEEALPLLLAKMEAVSSGLLQAIYSKMEVDVALAGLGAGVGSEAAGKNALALAKDFPQWWDEVHGKLQQMVEKGAYATSSSTAIPSGWGPLIEGALVSGQGAKDEAVLSALQGKSAYFHLTGHVVGRAQDNAISIASAVVQGTLAPEGLYRAEGKPDWGAVRKSAAMTKLLLSNGARLRVGNWAEDLIEPLRMPRLLERTEAGEWAKRGLAPSRAFFHRHPAWLAGSPALARNALFSAQSPEVYLKLLSAGTPEELDYKGDHPLPSRMMSMKGERERGFWASLCAQRMQKNLLDPYAKGTRQDLPVAATFNTSLFRAWIKKTKAKLGDEQIKYAISNQQFTVLRDLLKAGHFAGAKSEQVYLKIWEHLLHQLERPYELSDSKCRQAQEMVQVLSECSPDARMLAWSSRWSGKTHSGSLRIQSMQGEQKNLLIAMEMAMQDFTRAPTEAEAEMVKELIDANNTYTAELIERCFPSTFGIENANALFWRVVDQLHAPVTSYRYAFEQQQRMNSANRLLAFTSPLLGLETASAEEMQQRTCQLQGVAEKAREAGGMGREPHTAQLQAKIERLLLELSVAQAGSGPKRRM